MTNSNSEIKTTLKRLVLGELAARGRMNEEQIDDAIALVYRRAQMKCPWEHIEVAIRSLVCGRRIRQTDGVCEDEHYYTIRKPADRERQKEIFA